MSINEEQIIYPPAAKRTAVFDNVLRFPPPTVGPDERELRGNRSRLRESREARAICVGNMVP